MNSRLTLLLNNQGDLYQIASDRLWYYEPSPNDIIGTNICDMAIGAGMLYDVVMINHNGMYFLGNRDWHGSFITRPNRTPILYKGYKPI